MDAILHLSFNSLPTSASSKAYPAFDSSSSSGTFLLLELTICWHSAGYAKNNVLSIRVLWVASLHA